MEQKSWDFSNYVQEYPLTLVVSSFITFRKQGKFYTVVVRKISLSWIIFICKKKMQSNAESLQCV